MKSKCEITIKGTKFVIDYANNNLKQRTITVNDKKVNLGDWISRQRMLKRNNELGTKKIGLLNDIEMEWELKNNEELDLRLIIKALTMTFNQDDVYVSCNCPDFFYRFGYYATLNKINSGEPQLIPSKETNPDDDLGPACKHTLLVLANTT